jgi:hypothetical protein
VPLAWLGARDTRRERSDYLVFDDSPRPQDPIARASHGPIQGPTPARVHQERSGPRPIFVVILKLSMSPSAATDPFTTHIFAAFLFENLKDGARNPCLPALWLYTPVAFVTCTPAHSFHKCDQYKPRAHGVNAGRCFGAQRFARTDVIPKMDLDRPFASSDAARA